MTRAAACWVVALLAGATAGCAGKREPAPATAPLPAPRGAPNVLFIAVDDLRPALGCYGDPHAVSPHIDALAARGTVFDRAYCQQAVCSPSRNGVLTGRRPDTIRIYDLATNFRTTLPDVVTLPQHFKQNGYHAESMGKIFHVGHGNYDDRASWSVRSWNPPGRGAAQTRPAGGAAVPLSREAPGVSSGIGDRRRAGEGEPLIPSPLYAGERVRVRGGLLSERQQPLTLSLSPAYRGEGTGEDPHPDPLPAYRERGPDDDRESGSIDDLTRVVSATMNQAPATRPAAADRAAAKRRKGRPFAARDVDDAVLHDGQIASHAIERLGALKAQGQPFFLAVGFNKPHLPFVAPKKYWDLHDPATLPKGTPAALPQGAPRYAGSNSGELRQYQGVPDAGPIPADLAANLVHGYYACVSYTDAQVGRVLAALDDLGLRDDTIVVLWGDHGFHLGDHGLFCKHSNFEAAVRSTLIVAAPGRGAGGARTDALVEFVDIYPSLCDLAGLPLPSGLEGTSFTPLLRDPNTPWKSAAFSQWPKTIPGVGEGMGYSVRTDRYRLTEWTVPGKPYRAVELYDYEADPNESVNLADKPVHQQAVQALLTMHRKGWRGAVPP